jgi:hypothetical protein
MEPVMWFVLAMLLIAIVLGPKYGAEDRPAFKDPNIKPRAVVGSNDVGEWRPRI